MISPVLFEFDSPFPTRPGRIRLLEPPDSSVAVLSERLLRQDYDKPFIIDSEGERNLFFDLRYIQSTLCLKTPARLVLPYTRKMMACLLFQPEPRHMVQIGMGGGGLTRFCYAHLPQTRIVALESDPHVFALREHFLIPPNDVLFRAEAGDGDAYVRQQARQVDVLMLDAFDREGIAPAFTRPDFLVAARDCLSGDGMLVINLTGDLNRCQQLLNAAETAFGGRLLLLRVGKASNYILFAFRNPFFRPHWPTLKAQAQRLEILYELPLREDALALEQAARTGFRRLWRLACGMGLRDSGLPRGPVSIF